MRFVTVSHPARTATATTFTIMQLLHCWSADFYCSSCGLSGLMCRFHWKVCDRSLCNPNECVCVCLRKMSKRLRERRVCLCVHMYDSQHALFLKRCTEGLCMLIDVSSLSVKREGRAVFKASIWQGESLPWGEVKSHLTHPDCGKHEIRPLLWLLCQETQNWKLMLHPNSQTICPKQHVRLELVHHKL